MKTRVACNDFEHISSAILLVSNHDFYFRQHTLSCTLSSGYQQSISSSPHLSSNLRLIQTLPLHRQQLLDNSAFYNPLHTHLDHKIRLSVPKTTMLHHILGPKIKALMSLPYCIGTQNQRTLIVGPSSNRLRRCASTLGFPDNRPESITYVDASFRSKRYSKMTASGFRQGIGRHREGRYGK